MGGENEQHYWMAALVSGGAARMGTADTPGADDVTPLLGIVGIVGAAGAGKDAVAGFLRDCGFVCCAFADPLKVICAESFPAVDSNVWWGASELRNTSLRADSGLTAREALQTLGDWGRALDPDVWVRRGVQRARSLVGAIHPGVGSGPLGAHRDAEGTYWPALSQVDEEGRVRGVCLTDARFPNEAEAIRAVGGRIWRVARPPAEYVGPTVPPTVSAGWAESLALGGADRCDQGGWGSDKPHRKVWCWLLNGHSGACQGATERSPQWAAYRWAKGHPHPEIPPYDNSWRSHASETEGGIIEADLIVRNDGTLDDLREKVVSALAVTQAQGAWADWESFGIDHEGQE